MITRYSYKGITWIDALKPTSDEVALLEKEFSFDPHIAEELPLTIERSKVHTFSKQIYLVLQFPTLSNTFRGGKKIEVDFVLSEKFLLTVHYEPIAALEELVATFQKCSTEDGVCTLETPDDMPFRVISALYAGVSKEIETIEREVHTIEDYIFSGEQRKTVQNISETNHRLLDFKKTIRFHKDVLERLQETCEDSFKKLVPLVTQLRGEQEKLWNVIEHNKEIVEDLKKTNDSLLTHQTNEVIKFLAVLNFTTIPIVSIPAWLLLVDQNYIPTSGSVLSIVCLCLSLSLVIFLYLRKKWF